LPSNLKIANPTGHSGRHTASSIAFNTGLDAVAISKTTKHKDLRMIQRYAHSDDNSKMKTPMVVASSISSKQDVFDDVFVDEEDGEHFPELIPASTSSTSTHKRKRIDEDMKMKLKALMKLMIASIIHAVMFFQIVFVNLLIVLCLDESPQNVGNKEKKAVSGSNSMKRNMPTFNFHFHQG
jgi:hypothetical protein